jgi:hypothetical protein
MAFERAAKTDDSIVVYGMKNHNNRMGFRTKMPTKKEPSTFR